MGERKSWWGYVCKMIANYPTNRQRYLDSLNQSITPAYSEQVGGHEATRTVEDIVVRAMSKTQFNEWLAVDAAISVTALDEGKDSPTLKMIQIVFWERDSKGRYRKYRYHRAGEATGYSYRTVVRKVSNFIKLVGENFGFD
jgi:hypothetical protein